MILFPAIDLYENKAVRLFKGDYKQLTVYSDDPVAVAKTFCEQGTTHVHVVDLEGARDGTTPHLKTVERIVRETGLFVEIGGGIRSLDTVKRYRDAGVSRVILGTAAVTDEMFLKETLKRYGNAVSVGADLRDGKIAIKGWLESADCTADTFFTRMQDLGISHVIVTDISRDGAMKGTNRDLYSDLTARYRMNITASGGVSTLEDIRALKDMGLYGAILGKAYYTGAVSLREAIEVAL